MHAPPLITTAHSSEQALARPSFDEVYGQYAAFVWRLVAALGIPSDCVDDVAQDVFMVVHRNLAHFEARSTVKTWLFGIVRRVASDHRRKATRRKAESLSIDLSSTASPFADVSARQAVDLVVTLIQMLPEDQRAIFALVELEQWQANEVAEALGLNLNTTYSRLRLARASFAAHARIVMETKS